MDENERRQLFDQWMTDHVGLLFKVVRSFAESVQDREDLFQQIAIQLWTSLSTYNGSVAATTWIYRVAFYTAHGWRRKENVRTTKTNLLGERDASVVRESEPVDGRLLDLLDHIRELEEIDRSIALMLLDGLSYREMSELLGISESNVGVRIHRIKKRLVASLNANPEAVNEF
ncbi:MAG: sigma-70 family RNA polymerase sigma factor [Planctomycetota bacterium]